MFVVDSQPVVVQLLTGTAGSAPKREGGREGGREREGGRGRDKDSKCNILLPFLLQLVLKETSSEFSKPLKHVSAEKRERENVPEDLSLYKGP